MGVFATRSPFRPNNLGLSAVKLVSIEQSPGMVSLIIEGGDFVDGTPVIDIKPYIPYTDAIEASAGYAQEPPDSILTVTFSEEALTFLDANTDTYPGLKSLIAETLELDPRPQYKPATDTRIYGLALYDLNISFRINNAQASVLEIKPA